jgi:hypothetical protein
MKRRKKKMRRRRTTKKRGRRTTKKRWRRKRKRTRKKKMKMARARVTLEQTSSNLVHSLTLAHSHVYMHPTHHTLQQRVCDCRTAGR